MHRAYNSIYVIGHDGSILSVYDKVHLVPFGEYLPFQDLLERLGLEQLTKVRGGFIPGDHRHDQPVPGAPNFLPLVCYEIIFPAMRCLDSERPGWLYRHIGRYFDWPFVAGSGERPGWLLNLTNDGWFGASAGSLPAFSAGAGARDRRGPSAGAGGKYRHLGRGRSVWARGRVVAAGS